jgi:hypothetical protein
LSVIGPGISVASGLSPTANSVARHQVDAEAQQVANPLLGISIRRRYR